MTSTLMLCTCFRSAQVADSYEIEYIQRIPIPEKFEHWALMEGSILRSAVLHLDHPTTRQDYFFGQSYATEVADILSNSMGVASILRLIGMSFLIPTLSKIALVDVAAHLQNIRGEERSHMGITKNRYQVLMNTFSITASALEVNEAKEKTIGEELDELVKIVRINTVELQRRFCLFLTVTQNILRDSNFRMERLIPVSDEELPLSKSNIENNWRMPLITKAEQIYLCNLFEAFDTPKLGYLPGFAHVFESFARNSTVSLIESDFLEKISIQFSHNNVNLNLFCKFMLCVSLMDEPDFVHALVLIQVLTDMCYDHFVA